MLCFHLIFQIVIFFFFFVFVNFFIFNLFVPERGDSAAYLKLGHTMPTDVALLMEL